MRRTRGMANAFGAVNALLRSEDLALALQPHMAKVHWVEVVGPQVSGVTQIEAVRGGVLFVRVKNSVWANELTLLKEDMLRRLNAKLGGRVLTDIHFKASGLARPKKGSEKKTTAFNTKIPTSVELARIVLSEDSQARVEQALTGITEEALRGRIRQVMLHAARAEQWKRQQGWLPCARCGSLAAPNSDAPGAAALCHLCRIGA